MKKSLEAMQNNNSEEISELESQARREIMKNYRKNTIDLTQISVKNLNFFYLKTFATTILLIQNITDFRYFRYK